MNKKNKLWLMIVLICLGLAGVRPAMAQSDEELVLRLSRVFGYSSGTGKMQGSFLAKAVGPEGLERVVFYLDDTPIGEATTAPFNLSFNTDSYALGQHTLSAVGTTTDGREVRSNVIRAEFVTASAGLQSALRFLGPVLVGVVLLASLGVLLSTALGKQKDTPLGTPRNYGISGGTICPKCKRPFALHTLAANLGPGMKLDRCPYCGKWGLHRRVPLTILRAAEAAELATNDTIPASESEEERLRKELDNSRYHDL